MGISKLDAVDAFNRKVAQIKGRLFVSVADCCKRYNVSRRRIMQLILDGRIPEAYRVGGRWIVPAEWRYVRKRRGMKPNSKVGQKRPTFSLADPSKKVDNSKVIK